MAEANAGVDTSVASAAREVEEFLASGGWDQPTALFALVATDDLLAQQPELETHLDPDARLTPVAQESLPDTDLADALAGITWPETVHGCALAQEIVVLPPEAEPNLSEGSAPQGAHGDADSAGTDADTDDERLRRAAANHPQRTEARLVAAVTRDGTRACVMRMRAQSRDSGTEHAAAQAGGRAGGQERDEHTSGASGHAPDDGTDEIIEHPDLAPNLLDALEDTLRP